MPFEQCIPAGGLDDPAVPKYLAIAESLANAILGGQLAAGERLPPQRRLAARLQVTAGTISRAYAHLELRGLAIARVGDGTYVRPLERGLGALARPTEPAIAPINLAHNVALAGRDSDALIETFADLARNRAVVPQLLTYQPESGAPAHRDAGARWLRRFGLHGDRHRVMVTHGAQHALACVMRTLARPGDVVLTEALSYPGLLELARALRLQLIGVDIDEQGLVPEALERAARTFDSRLLFCSPTLHNPTTASMSPQRRERIATVARRCRLLVIEDCVLAAALAEPPPALATWLPERTFLIASFSKIVAPGLRVGYLDAPPEWMSKLAASMRADCWMVAPLMPEIASRWIDSGELDRLIDEQRVRIDERLACARAGLQGLELRSAPGHPLLWLRLPSPWRAGPFAHALSKQGITVRTPEHFAAGRSPLPDCIRLSVNAVESIGQLTAGLEGIRRLASQRP